MVEIEKKLWILQKIYQAVYLDGAGKHYMFLSQEYFCFLVLVNAELYKIRSLLVIGWRWNRQDKNGYKN